MFRLFCKKKKRLSRTDFVALMLSFQQRIVSFLLKSAQQWREKLPGSSFQLDPYECEIFSLCMLSLAIQDKDPDLRNTIYIEYCRHRNFDTDTRKRFLGHLDMRCIRYYDAFNEYLKDHKGGCVLGSVVANGLKGDASDKLELDITNMFKASSLFINSFQSTVEYIEDLKKKYDLSEVSSVFVE